MIDARHPAGQPFFYEGNDTGVLLIHGFTGTCGQMRPLGEALRGAGYTVMAPLLPGHGTSLEDMSRTSGGDWLHCVRDAYVSLEKMVERVVVCGLSMGGTLATILAEEYNPVGLATLSGAIRVREKFAWAAGALWRLKPYLRWTNLEHDGDYDNSVDACYAGLPVRKVADLNRLRALARRNLALIDCPALVVQPTNDETVDPVSARILMQGIRSPQKKLVMLENSPHVCTLGPEREKVFREVIDFVRSVARGILKIEKSPKSTGQPLECGWPEASTGGKHSVFFGNVEHAVFHVTR